MGRRQFHTGEEGQGGNFGNKRRATGKRSPVGPYFQLNSLNNFSASRFCCWLKSLYVIIEITVRDHVLEKHSRITWCKVTNRVAAFISWTPEKLDQWYADRRDFLALLSSHATRAWRSPGFHICSSEIRKNYASVFCRLSIYSFLVIPLYISF